MTGAVWRGVGRPTPGDLAGVVATAAATVLVLVRPPVSGVGASWAAACLVLGAAFGAAAMVVRRDGEHRRMAAWATASAGALLVLSLLEAAADRDPRLLWLEQRGLAAVLGLVLPGLVLSFPTGRPGSVIERMAAALVAVCGVALVVVPGAPVAVPAWSVLATAVGVAVWVRSERANDVDRERILWLLLGAGGAVVVGGHLLFAAHQVSGAVADTVVLTLVLLCGLAVPVTLAIALVAPRAFDVRAATAWVAASILMVDLTLGVLSGTLALFEIVADRAPSRLVIASVCVVVAAGFHPAWLQVRETLERVLFGGRPDPVGVVSTLGDELRRGGGPQQWLEALRVSVDLPSVALHDHDEVVASAGHTGGSVTTIALHAGEDHVGDLVVGLPEHLRELPRATHAVLRLVAAPLARALQSARLAEELQRSRRRVVLAAEEERRRLQRDLHDGLGPVLAGVAYTADAARNDIASRPGRATELLIELRADVTGAIAEVRRIVHDLRPPVLDQLGLVPALRQQAERITQDADGPVVSLEAAAIGTLPAAVEVAAYRVVAEAVFNAVRHARAHRVAVVVRREPGTLDLLVVDDGPPGAPWAPGVGLTSMRERLEHLGGELEVGATPEGGRVHAQIPVSCPEMDHDDAGPVDPSGSSTTTGISRSV